MYYFNFNQMKNVKIFSVAVALTFAFSACNRDLPNDDGLDMSSKLAVATGFVGELYQYGNITPPTYNSFGSNRFNNGEAWDLNKTVRIWRPKDNPAGNGNGNGPCFITFYKGVSDESSCYGLAVRYAGGNNGNSGNGASGSGSTNLAWNFNTIEIDSYIDDPNAFVADTKDYLVALEFSKEGEYITFRLDYPLKVNVDNPWYNEDGEVPSTEGGELEYGEDGEQLRYNVWNTEVMNPGDTHIAQINWGGPTSYCERIFYYTVTYLDWCDKVVGEFSVVAGSKFNHTIVAGYAIGWWTDNGLDQTGGSFWSEQGFMDAFHFEFKSGYKAGDVRNIRWEIKDADGNFIKDKTDPDLIYVKEDLLITPYADAVQSTNPECNPPCATYKVGFDSGDGQAQWAEIEIPICDGECFGDLIQQYTPETPSFKWNKYNEGCTFIGWALMGDDDAVVITEDDYCDQLPPEDTNHSGYIVLQAQYDCCTTYDVVFTDEFGQTQTELYDACIETCFGDWVNKDEYTADMFKWTGQGKCQFLYWEYNGVKVEDEGKACHVLPVAEDGKIYLKAKYNCPLSVVGCMDFMDYLYDYSKDTKMLLPEAVNVFSSTNLIVKELFQTPASVLNYVEITQKTNLYLTFLSENAGWNSVLGYFVIPASVAKNDAAELAYYNSIKNSMYTTVGSGPTARNVLKNEYVIFNRIKDVNNGNPKGTLASGDVFQIGTTEFNVGDRVVFFLSPDGYQNNRPEVTITATTGTKQIFFMHKGINKATIVNGSNVTNYSAKYGAFAGVQFMSFFSGDCRSMVVCVEDWHRGSGSSDTDCDFNDIIFSITDNIDNVESTSFERPPLTVGKKTGSDDVEIFNTSDLFK